MKRNSLIRLIVLVVGGLLAWNVLASQPEQQPNMNQASSNAIKERKILYWYDPMKPDQHFDKPGKSPYMNMDLLPKYKDEIPVNDSTHKMDQPTKAPATKERKVLYWYDPMKPDQHFDKPGKSPYMDMELLPKYEDEHSQNELKNPSARFKQAFNVRLGRPQLDDQQKLWVPSEAVLLTGKKAIVFVSEGNGYFNPVEVQVAQNNQAMTQVNGTLNEQQSIALSAQFLIDAESNVNSELAYIKGQ